MTSSCRRRRDSGELDVFEATKYFSGGIEGIHFSFASSTFPPQINTTRKSFELPLKPVLPPEEQIAKPDQKISMRKEKKNFKHPVTPGGRFASFLYSLFQQTACKNRKNKKGKEEEKAKKYIDSDVGRRRKSEGEEEDELNREKGRGRRSEEEERGERDNESDSSSDLFELNSYDFSDLSCELPLYGTRDE
ncbi:hypothetical protein AXF42_Ash004263 [Apostasia shenzhenica]|uniref:Protein BIG GRAIN 1-like E n=1 Tax=Apostasia shenzhenica TaxID=1088818 RepID=A0A2I0A2E2_9ASPA|nr:hypothetical protein AXF42_Ash004263 [Apostasia shenzhenica]